MTATTLMIDTAFGWVLLEVTVIALHVLVEGFAVAPVRKRLFKKVFYEKNFPELLKDRTVPLPELGYPDMGSGQFSQKLSLPEWTEFNNAIRVHYNYLEGVTSCVTLMLVSGLFFPRYTAVLGATYIAGRVCYGIGYRKKGARGRFLGAGLFDLSLIGLLGGALYGAFTFAGGFAGLRDLISA